MRGDINPLFYKDIAGMKFNKWNVIKDNVGKNKNGYTLCLCCCDCQYALPESEREYREVSKASLLNGTSRSCGCMNSKPPIKKMKKNSYDITSFNYGVGYTEKQGKEFYFDLEDYEKIEQYHWYINDQDYVLSGTINGHGKSAVRMHRFLLGVNDNRIIDHINTNRRDNRKANLRFSNKSLNGINRKHNKNNKLGVKGVREIRRKKGAGYVAEIYVDGKKKHLGTFDTIEEAAQARRKIEIEVYGEYAYMPNEDEEIKP